MKKITNKELAQRIEKIEKTLEFHNIRPEDPEETKRKKRMFFPSVEYDLRTAI